MPTQTGFIAKLGKVRLTLDATPQPNPTGGDILAVVILTTDRDQQPLEGETVTFWRGRDEETTQVTDPHGRASHAFSGFDFGTHAVSIQIGGIAVPFRHAFQPITERRLPHKLNVRIAGERGNYRLIITVTAEDKRFLPNAPLVVVRNSTTKALHTPGNGALVYPVRHEAHVSVSAGEGPDLNWDGMLQGK